MKNLLTVACMATLIIFSSQSSAENTVYIGIAAGATFVSADDVDEDTSSKIIIGFRPDDHLALEAALFSTGEASLAAPSGTAPANLAAFNDVTIESSGLNLAALYVFPKKILGIGIAAGGGVYIFDTEVTDPSLAGIGDSEQDSFGASLHGRAEYLVLNALALRLDLDMFIGVETLGQDKTVTSLTAGLAYTF